jgi:2'-5' RNA ligase
MSAGPDSTEPTGLAVGSSSTKSVPTYRRRHQEVDVVCTQGTYQAPLTLPVLGGSVPVVANPGPQSILLVEVPEAQPIVGRYREQFVANARLGVPAHISVLYPFMPPRAIGPAVIAELEHLFATVSRFRFQLTHIGWFGDEVLWLGPRDPAPFRALTRRVAEAFPDFPPYEGQFGGAESEASPHLTVGKGDLVTELRSAEADVRSHLPIGGEANSVTLMTQSSTGGLWTKTATFALA